MKILAFVCLSLLVLTGCSGASSLYKEAKKAGTPPAYAKALLIHSNALGTQVAVLRESPMISEQGKTLLLAGYRKMVCSDEELTTNVETSQCDEGPTYQLDSAGRASEGVINAQTQEALDKAVDALVPLIADLIDKIAGVAK